MPNIQSSGTVTGSTSEQTIFTSSANANFILTISLANMVTASASSTTLPPDQVEIFAKTAVLSSTTYLTCYAAAYHGLQGIPIKTSVPIAGAYGVAFTLRQYQGGAARSFDWRVDVVST